MAMDPYTAAALIQTGSGLLGALFAPSKKKEMQWERENAQKMEGWRAGQIESKLKPQTPYYQSGNLPQLGGASTQAVMGNLMQRLGPEMLAKWGINPAVQGPAPMAQPPMTRPIQKERRPVSGGFPGQEILMNRYGV